MYPDIQGKVAIVTGSGRPGGLGEAIARKLGSEGARVVVHDLGAPTGGTAPRHGIGMRDEMEAVAEAIRADGGDATTFAADMREEREIEALVDHAAATYGGVDILINNAGVGFLFAPILDITAADWDTVLDVNLRGCFLAMKHAVRRMIAQGPKGDWGAGRVVSIASKAAKTAGPLTSSYAASKHGLVGLTRAAAVEFGPHKVTVNAVCPNHVTTGLGAWQNDYIAGARGMSVDDYLDAMRQRIPLGRVGLPDDTANACAFLCSGQANYITGEAMNVSGGEEYH